MMNASPPTPFKMSEPEPLLEFLIIALDAPAQLDSIDQAAEGDVFRKGRESVFGRLVLAFRPLDQQPLFRPTVGETVITMRDTNVHARKARGQPVGRTFPPLDCAVDGGRKLFVIRRQIGSSPPIEIRSGIHTIITGPPWLDFQLKSRGHHANLVALLPIKVRWCARAESRVLQGAMTGLG
jgi:hypothetical protein